ncbi:hypothetical protein ACP4OV_024623 [Aristida adscensionis]
MDFMKVLDQTVREIKREVNLKVLRVPEIEQKVLDATSDEPWGPHGSDLADIARATKRLWVPQLNGECALIMNVLWQRLRDTGANWRRVYKALAIIEYLLANGTERAVDEIIDNSPQIATLTSFKYLEPNGKDAGLNVRKKAETVLAIVDDREKLQQVREKAAATRDKYFGLSSTGVTHKSSASASFSSSSYSSGSHYGSTGSSRETVSFRNNYRGNELAKGNSSKEAVSGYSATAQMSKENKNGAASYKSTKGEEHGRRRQASSTSHSKPSSNLSTTSGGSSSQKLNYEDDDDFNPRGSSASGKSSNKVDLFVPSLVGDPVDAAAFTAAEIPNVGTAAVPVVDLFANTTLQSANSPSETVISSQVFDSASIDLFACRSSFASSDTSEAEFSVRGSPNKSSKQNLPFPAHNSESMFDPFQTSFATFPSGSEFSCHDTPSKSLQENNPTPQHASVAYLNPSTAIRQKSFDASSSFVAFSSNTGSDLTETRHDSPRGMKSSDNGSLEERAFTSPPATSAMNPMNKLPTKLEPSAMSASKPDMKKGAFQVKSDIWADSLSRGLIDLNIASPKKIDLSGVGVAGQLSDGSEKKGPAAPWCAGATVGTGPGLGSSGFPSSAGIGGRGDFHHHHQQQQQQQQFGSFK